MINHSKGIISIIILLQLFLFLPYYLIQIHFYNENSIDKIVINHFFLKIIHPVPLYWTDIR